MRSTTQTAAAAMSRAWNIYHKHLTRYPQERSRATFASCLRAAWTQARDPRDAWAALDGDTQAAYIKRMILGPVLRRYEALAENPTSARAYILGYADTITADAWMRTARALACIGNMDADAQPAPLSIVVYRAAYAAVRATRRQEQPHIDAVRLDTDTGREYVEHVALSTHDADPAAAVALRDCITRAQLDDTDRRIYRAAAVGRGQQEIGDALGISHQAVSKRLARIAARLRDELRA